MKHYLSSMNFANSIVFTIKMGIKLNLFYILRIQIPCWNSSVSSRLISSIQGMNSLDLNAGWNPFHSKSYVSLFGKRFNMTWSLTRDFETMKLYCLFGLKGLNGAPLIKFLSSGQVWKLPGFQKGFSSFDDPSSYFTDEHLLLLQYFGIQSCQNANKTTLKSKRSMHYFFNDVLLATLL